MRINGLIIPRSYNDYFSRSDPQAIKNLIAMSADAQLNTESTNPIQNKAVAVLIPATANENNKLTDINFVNSTVGTNTANYIYKTDTGGNKIPFSSVTELEEYTGTVTQNDYAFVTGTDSDGNIYFDRYKANVSGDVVTWAKEYRLNNSSFTAAQWAAISSGITAELVAQIGQGGSGDNTPIGAILPYGGANAPAGYIICDGRAVSRTDYDKLYEKIGVTFGAGDGSTTFNVPDLRDKVAQGANGNLGVEIEAGLPNITGSLARNSNFGIVDQSSGVSGAFKLGETVSNGLQGTSGANYKINFDANNSNDIYGNSDTVQPPAVAVNFIIKATASTGEVPADVELDDDKTTTANVWSASKTKDEIENAVEEVDNKNNYSTTETVIGKWIDGKPIYKKVIDVRQNNKGVSNFELDINSMFIDTLINANCIGNLTDSYLGAKWVLNSVSGTGSREMYIDSNGKLTSKGSEYKFYVILEYTKTTDSAAV